jgi:hypothetical protein
LLSDRERQALEEIERRLLRHDPAYAQRFDADRAHASSPDAADPTAEAYAALAVISGVLAVLLVTRWPVLSAALLVMAAANWRLGKGTMRPSRRPHGKPPQP